MKRYKALIVDDEFAARETLRLLVDWEKVGFEPPVTASNGESALKLYKQEKYDLVLTDIEMPVMNGIDLIIEIQKIDPQQHISIISCHEKFEYAYQAIKLGVDDYLIKDLITANELTAFLSSFVLHDVTDSSVHNSGESKLHVLLHNTVQSLPMDTSTELGYACVAVFCILFDEYDQLRLDKGTDTLIDSVGNFLEALSCPAYYNTNTDTIYIVYDIQIANSTLYFFNNAITLSNTIRSKAKTCGLKSVSIGVSDPVTSASRLAKACSQAFEAVNIRILQGTNKTFLYNTISLKKDALDYKHMDYLLNRIEDMSYNANIACLRLIDKLYAMELPNTFADINYYKYINSRLWSIIIIIAQSIGQEYDRVIDSMGLSIDDINHMESSAMMAQFFKSFLLNLFSANGEPDNENIVNRALNLIEREYTGDVSLSYIAEKLHTHKSYLCRSFKEQTGGNIMSHIMKKKISRAQYLLCNTQMKLYEISDSLSFASPQYFSAVFKRYTGVSPNEYKKNIISEDADIQA